MNTEYFQTAMAAIQKMDNQSRDIENETVLLKWRVTNLTRVLMALRNNVDVSTINNSAKSTAKWSELVKDVDHMVNHIESDQQARDAVKAIA